MPGSDGFVVDFDASQAGQYTAEALNAEWNNPSWSNGVDTGRVSIIQRDGKNNVLGILYPAGEYGSRGSGAQWQRDFAPVEAAYARYAIRFADDFDFVLGGKLPGLAGGEANAGGNAPTGVDGWSARMMWREEGCIVFYVYHVDQPGEFGQDVGWGTAFERGQWHVVELLGVMNEPGKNDGVLMGWLDGRLVADRRDLRFRDVETLKIDML